MMTRVFAQQYRLPLLRSKFKDFTGTILKIMIEGVEPCRSLRNAWPLAAQHILRMRLPVSSSGMHPHI
jgi:hypothetical protein